LQGLDAPLLAALPAWLAGFVLWPLASPSPEGAVKLAPAAAIALVALAIAGVLRFTSPWSARYPNAVEPVYVTQPAAGRAWRASLLGADDWTLAFIRADMPRAPNYFALGREQPETMDLPVLRVLSPGSAGTALVGAPAKPLAAPPATVAVQQASGGTVTLKADMAPQAVKLQLLFRVSAPVEGLAIDGRPAGVAPGPGDWIPVEWAGPDGVAVSFRPKTAGTLEVSWAEVVPGLPAGATPAPPMPAADMGWDIAGSTLVTGGLKADVKGP
jgi:hypothetical protein